MYNREGELTKSVDLAKGFEGFSPVIYYCPSNHPTLGYGRNLDVYPLDDHESEEVTEAEAEVWLRGKIADCRFDLAIFCPWFVNSPEGVRLVLTDMAYNLGTKGLLGFRKMLAALKADDFSSAAEELKDSKYFKQTGLRALYHYNLLKSLTE